MELFLWFAAGLFVWVQGAYSGWKLREKYIKNSSKQSSLPSEDEKPDEDDLVRITIEEHNGVFYIYNKKDKTFMVQGKTKQEIEDALSSRFPGKRFAATLEELKKIGMYV
jgi:hypothetical protein